MVIDLPVPEFVSPPPRSSSPLVDVLVRALTADGLKVVRTGPDRLEVGTPSGLRMEWCFIADLLFGRSCDDLGEAAWIHRVPAGPDSAPFELARAISRVIRELD